VIQVFGLQVGVVVERLALTLSLIVVRADLQLNQGKVEQRGLKLLQWLLLHEQIPQTNVMLQEDGELFFLLRTRVVSDPQHSLRVFKILTLD